MDAADANDTPRYSLASSHRFLQLKSYCLARL